MHVYMYACLFTKQIELNFITILYKFQLDDLLEIRSMEYLISKTIYVWILLDFNTTFSVWNPTIVSINIYNWCEHKAMRLLIQKPD